mmetsp:Transcript_2617/g.7894  ORF Transcript_2617/g.7894 Transcript_2617/m.7894 type:complete len:231 (-) Transcript_2617:170-862(-)
MTVGMCVPWYPIPMKLLNTLFLDAMALKCSKNSDSVIPSWYLPKGMPSVLLMASGTVASTSASMLSKPHSFAISVCCSGVMLLCLGANMSPGLRASTEIALAEANANGFGPVAKEEVKPAPLVGLTSALRIDPITELDLPLENARDWTVVVSATLNSLVARRSSAPRRATERLRPIVRICVIKMKFYDARIGNGWWLQILVPDRPDLRWRLRSSTDRTLVKIYYSRFARG